MARPGFRSPLVVGALVLSLLATVGGVAAGTPNTASGAKDGAQALQAAPAQPVNFFFFPPRKFGVCESHITLHRHFRGVGQLGGGFRTLETTIFYPRTDIDGCLGPSPGFTRFFPGVRRWAPLILFSHGLGAPLFFYRTLLTGWASAGYVVAFPEYPLSKNSVAGPTSSPQAKQMGLDDVVNQPADAKFVIDRVLNEDSTNDLAGGKIDPTRIGASGHSLGAITTYGLAYRNCCRDPRIGAAISLSGCAGIIDSRAGFFSGATTPLLILHGSDDPYIPLSQALLDFNAANPTANYVALLNFLGADHNAPFGGDVISGDGFQETPAQATAVQRATLDWWDRFLKDDGSALNRFNNDINVPGGIQNVPPGPSLTPIECRDALHL